MIRTDGSMVVARAAALGAVALWLGCNVILNIEEGQLEGGAPEFCAPMTEVTCYTGPDGTLNHGPCRSGTRTCNADGTGYGPCEGDVTPRPEDCATPLTNENCDDEIACAGSPLWSKSFGDADHTQDMGAAAIDGAGDVVLVGTFAGTIDFGGGPLTAPAGARNAFFAKLDSAGNHLWSRQILGAAGAIPKAVATDEDRNIVVAGRFSGAVDFGDGQLDGDSGDLFVVKLDPSGGTMWSRRFGGPNTTYDAFVAIGPSGSIVVQCDFSVSITFGDHEIAASGGDNMAIAMLDADGDHVWSHGFSPAFPGGVAVDSNGDVLMAAAILGSANFGGDPLVSAGGVDCAVAKFDGQGGHVWSERFGDTSSQGFKRVAVDDARNVILVSEFWETADFGDGPLFSAGGSDIAVTKLDAQGSHQWSLRSGGPDDDYIGAVAASGAGEILLTGAGDGINFGGGTVTTGAFAAKLAGTGAHIWSRGEMDSEGVAITADPATNHVVLAGELSGGNGDVFAAKLTP